jgi:hypothetical protein
VKRVEKSAVVGIVAGVEVNAPAVVPELKIISKRQGDSITSR